MVVRHTSKRSPSNPPVHFTSPRSVMYIRAFGERVVSINPRSPAHALAPIASAAMPLRMERFKYVSTSEFFRVEDHVFDHLAVPRVRDVHLAVTGLNHRRIRITR